MSCFGRSNRFVCLASRILELGWPLCQIRASGAMLKASSAQKMQSVLGEDQHSHMVKLLYMSFKEELAHFSKVSCR